MLYCYQLFIATFVIAGPFLQEECTLPPCSSAWPWNSGQWNASRSEKTASEKFEESHIYSTIASLLLR